MSENQSLEIIENKLENLERMLDQQSKSGVFFDGFTKQVLENIHNKLEYISNFETNELITYLTEEMKRTMDDKHNVLQLRLDSVQGLINNIQANMSDSLKTPEIIQTFNKLSDSILDFSRDLNAQTRYFSSTVENIHTDIGRINIDSKLEAQTSDIKAEVDSYRINVEHFASDINSNFDSIKRLIEANTPSEALTALSGDVSIIQKGLNDIINAVVTVNNKQAELVSSISGISAGADVQDIRLDVSSMLTEMQVLKEAVRVLVNKSDIEAINEKLNYAIESVSNIKELASYNDNENKTIFKTYFNDLTNMLSSIVSKEEGELIKSKLEFILSGIEEGKQDIKEILEQSNNKISGLLDGFSTSQLATKENLNDFSQSTIKAINSITAQWNEKIVQNSEAIDEKLNGFRSALSSIYEAVSQLASKVNAGKDASSGLLREDIAEIISQVDSTKNYLSQYAQNVDSSLASKLAGVTEVISERTVSLENLVNGLQDNLRNSLSENINQLKDFAQTLTVSVSDFGGQLNLRTEAIKSVLDEHYNDLGNKIISVGSRYDSKLEEIKAALGENKNALDSQVATLEEQLIVGKDEIKSVLNEGYSTLATQVSEINDKNTLKVEEIKSAVEDRFDALNEKVVSIASQYAEFAGTNKGEILAELSSLRSIAEASKSAMHDDKVFAMFDEKLNAVVAAIQAGKTELLNANLNITEAASGQITILDTINNSIKDLYINLSDGRVAASSHKDEIVNSISQKIYDLTNLVDTLRTNLTSDFSENKSSVEKEVEAIKVLAQDVKTTLNEINQNQASKQILAAILENVTGKIDEVSNLVSLNKDFNLEQYDNIKQLNLDLKNNISDIIVHLNQSSEFASNLFDRMSAGFTQTIEEVTGKTSALREELVDITSSQKTEVVSKVNQLQEQLSTVQSVIASFNFDESVKEQLLELKHQIEAFNQQSLVDILNQVTENNEQTGQNVQNTINSIKMSFESLLNKIGNVEIQTNVLREELLKHYTDKLKEVSDKVEVISGEVVNSAYKNKEQILNEVANLQNYSTSLQEEVKAINENMLKSDFVVAQTERVSSLINNFVANFSARFDEISNTDKGYVAQVVKESFSEFQQQISSSINYLKSLNLNLDRTLAANQASLLEGFDAIQAASNKNIEEITNAKAELASKIDTASNNVVEIIAKNVEQRQQIKQELSASIDNISKEIKANLEQANVNSNQVKDEVIAKLNEVTNIAEETKTSLSQTQAEANQNLVSALNSMSETVNEKLSKTVEQSVNNKSDIISELSNVVLSKASSLRDSFDTKLQDTFARFNERISEFAGKLQENSLNNKEQILTVVDGLKSSINGINTDIYELLQSTQKETFDSINEKFNSNISEIDNKLVAFGQGLNESSTANKEQLFAAIRQVRDSLEQFRDDSKTALAGGNEIIRTELVDLLQNNLQVSMNRLDSISEILQKSLFANRESIIAELDIVKAELNEHKNSYNDLKQNITEVQEIIVNDFAAKLDKVSMGAADIIKNVHILVDNSNVDLTDKIENLGQFIDDIKSELNSSFDNQLRVLVQNVQSNIETNFDKMNSSVGTLGEKTQEVKTIVENLDKKVDVTSQRAEELNDEIKQMLGTSFANITEILSTGHTENNEFQENIKFEFKKVIDEIASKLLKLDEESSGLKDSLLFELKKSYNVIGSKVETQLDAQEKKYAIFEEKIDENRSKTEEFIREENYKLTNNVVEGLAKELDLEAFREAINGDISEASTNMASEMTLFAENLAQNFKLTNEFIQDTAKLEASYLKKLLDEMELGQIKEDLSKNIVSGTSSIAEKIGEISALIVENKTLYESVSKSNKNDVLTKLDFLKADIESLTEKSGYEQLSNDIAAVSERIEKLSDDLLDTIAGNLEGSFADNIKLINENIEDKISYIKDDIQGIMLGLGEVDSVVDRVKEAVALQFENYFDSFDSKIDVLGEDIRKYFDNQTEKITSAIDEYQKELNNLCDIDLSEYSEDTKKFVEEQINELRAHLAELQNSDNLDNAVEQITGTVNASSEVINKHLTSIRDIIMAEMPNGEEISDNFDDLRAALSDINMKTKGIADIVKDENASLRDVIEKYQAGITALSNLDSSSYHDETKGFIKSELQQLKEQFIKNLTSVFENISFIEEAEEIQNVIYDNTDDIKNEINQLKKELVENSNSNGDIDEKFNNLKNILESITSGSSVNSGQYLYTLPDVETDIAKMRMAINDITSMLKQSQDDENGVAERLDSIDDIRDDISSISKRTNKLILTSEESNKHLKENISEFRRIIEDVNRKCESIDNTPIYNNLNDIRALMISSLNSDQTLNEVFMHLAEWIDDSSHTLNSISDKVDANDEKFREIDHSLDKISERVEKVDDKFDEISRIKDALSDLSAKLDKKLDTDYSKFLYDIECGLDKLSDKLEVQELKIKSLEKKIDNLANAPAASDEVTSLLEFIASQATAANENSRGNKALLQKIDMVEKKVEQFEESISKITAFIDGVN